MILPEHLVPFSAHGSGNVGDVTDGANGTARFSLGCCVNGFALVDLCVRNSGGSAGRADLIMRIDHHLGPAYDFNLKRWTNFGNGATSDKSNIKRVYEQWEMRSWMFTRNGAGVLSEMVFEWTNPNNQDWAIFGNYTDIANLGL